MTIDPYKTLGIAKDASDEDIKRAFKRAAKQAHPDTGGSAEAFGMVKLAHTVLSHKETRTRYDATGQIDEPQIDHIEDAAMQLIAMLIGSVLAQEKDPSGDDIIAQMVRHFREEQQTITKQIAAMNRVLSRVTKLKSRFKRKGDGENILVRMVDWKEREAKAQIASFEQQAKSRERAIEMLKDYSFERDVSAAYNSQLYQQYLGRNPYANATTSGLFR